MVPVADVSVKRLVGDYYAGKKGWGIKKRRLRE